MVNGGSIYQAIDWRTRSRGGGEKGQGPDDYAEWRRYRAVTEKNKRQRDSTETQKFPECQTADFDETLPL